MRLLISTVLFVCCFSLTAVVAQKRDPDWYAKMKQIVPLVSTYDSVTSVFEQPAKGQTERSYGESIESSDGKFFIMYATGKCVESGGQAIGWKVPKWTVISISFTPRKRTKPENLPFPLAGFRSYEVSDVPGAFIYENDTTGIEYGLHRDGTVEDVSFNPPKSMEYLHC